jgi:hypothetical protein
LPQDFKGVLVDRINERCESEPVALSIGERAGGAGEAPLAGLGRGDVRRSRGRVGRGMAEEAALRGCETLFCSDGRRVSASKAGSGWAEVYLAAAAARAF